MKRQLLLLILISTISIFQTGCFKKTLAEISEKENPLSIRPIYPTVECPVREARPKFSWTPLKTIKSDVKYQFVLVKMKDKQDVNTAIKENEKLAKEDGIEGTSIEMPTIASDLKPNSLYAFQIAAYGEADRKIISKSEVCLFYTLDEKMPEYFQDLLCCVDNRIEKTVTKWRKAYGEPEIDLKSAGCLNTKGTILMRGNRTSGDGMFQVLENKFEKDKHYQISFCAKPIPKETDYVRFRFIAYNGTLPSNGNHPNLSASKALIGESGDIKNSDWNRYFLSSWKAAKDYEKIAIFVVTNENTIGLTQAMGRISNICIKEVEDCGLLAGDIGFSGEGSIPGDAKDFISESDPPEPIEIENNLGKLTDLFGKPFDDQGNSNWYHLNDDCISVGTEIPPEAEDEVKKYMEFKLPGEISLETFDEGMNTFFEKEGKKLEFPDWEKIPEEKKSDCHVQYDKSKPFNGRDIIYVHGLVLDHVLKRTIANDESGYLKSAALATSFSDEEELANVAQVWPDDKDAFFDDGFYHKNAKSYFDDHIDHFLGDHENPSNRYMLVAFNSAQPLIENVHAALMQIALAMNEGTGVVYDEKNDPRGADCFGKDVVIISHSTGGLLMDVTLAMAGMAGSDENIEKAFGDIQYIAKRSKVHIALHGALAGSELAALAVFGANLSAVSAVGADVAVDMNIAVDNAIETGQQIVIDAVTGMNTAGTTNNTDAFEAFMDAATDELVVLTNNLATSFNNSILVDLSPVVAKGKWAEYINKIKVPVLTVAGGHPGNIDEKIFTKIVLPGFDDGVVSANSQSGSPSMIWPELYQYIPPEGRIFDKGIDLRRSVPYFGEQSKGVLGAAYGSIPFLSPTGMVQPVALFSAPSPRYANHFPFLQSASEHMHSFSDDLTYTPTAGASNLEECLVLENNFVFDNDLVHADISSQVIRQVRGQDLVITFTIYYPVVEFWPIPPTVNWENYSFTLTIPIWRRTYDTLSGSNYETSFVYNYVLRP